MSQAQYTIRPEILCYYEYGQESERLDNPLFRWEKVRTLDLLDRFLPRPPAMILDVGGGAGAYAFYLAEKGYVVDVVDPVPFHIEQAKGFKTSLAEQMSARTKNRPSKATLYATLNALKRFFSWLAGQPGYKSRISYSDAEYFNLSSKETRTFATA